MYLVGASHPNEVKTQHLLMLISQLGATRQP
jgi:hypothetical protein